MSASARVERTIYLDHAATAYPRADGVAEAMAAALNIAGSAGRGGHGGANEAQQIVTSCRSRVAELWGVADPGVAGADRIVIYPSATAALNTLIADLVPEGNPQGKQLLLGPLEHNSVVRPAWRRCGSDGLPTLPADVDGRIEIDRAGDLDLSRVVAVIVQHASNVNGIVQPLDEISAWCEKVGLPLIVDGAQAAGLVPLDLSALPAVHAYVAAGHKFLGGPPGIGVAYFAAGCDPTPLWVGGNGVDSGALEVPTSGPARYESGTSNLPAIAGLAAALRELTRDFVAERFERAQRLRQEWLAALEAIPDLRVIGDQTRALRTPVISLTATRPPGEMAAQLESELGVRSRSGLHCAPSAHEYFGTAPLGTFRIAPNPDTMDSKEDQADRTAVIDFLSRS